MITALILLSVAQPTRSEMNEYELLVTVNVGWVLANSDVSGDGVNGYSMAAHLQKMTFNDRTSLGILLSYIDANDDFVSDGDNVRTDFATWPILATATYYLGNPRRWLHGYVGWGAGFHISTLNTVTAPEGSSPEDLDDLPGTSEDQTGLAVNMSLGGLAFFSNSFFADASYRLYWLNRSYYKHNLVHVLNLGLGFKF